MGRETRRDGTDEEKSLAVNAGNTVWAIIPSRYPGKYTIDKLPPRYYSSGIWSQAPFGVQSRPCQPKPVALALALSLARVRLCCRITHRFSILSLSWLAG